jgi:hypothetical protein
MFYSHFFCFQFQPAFLTTCFFIPLHHSQLNYTRHTALGSRSHDICRGNIFYKNVFFVIIFQQKPKVSKQRQNFS